MDNQIQPTKKLNAKLSDFKTPLTFNEWVEMHGVSSQYVEPTKYFQGNVGCGLPMERESVWDSIKNYFIMILS